MTAPPDHGLARIATFLRPLAAREELRADAGALLEHANYLDRADRELQTHALTLRKHAADLIALTPEDAWFLRQID